MEPSVVALYLLGALVSGLAVPEVPPPLPRIGETSLNTEQDSVNPASTQNDREAGSPEPKANLNPTSHNWWHFSSRGISGGGESCTIQFTNPRSEEGTGLMRIYDTLLAGDEPRSQCEATGPCGGHKGPASSDRTDSRHGAGPLQYGQSD